MKIRRDDRPADHRPRKRFGQHFLHDPAVIERIIRAIGPRAGDRMVEIGPGTGNLTAALLQHVDHLHVVELDRDLAAHLQSRFGKALTLHLGDALTFDFSRLAGGDKGLRVVGNLPYNISTPLLFHLLGFRSQIRDMHFMLQLEVVERMTATPGGREYGRLSVMVQYHCDCTRLFRVAPGAFTPPPRVESAVVRLVPRPPPLEATDPGLLGRLVTTAFGQRRKTLRNALRSLAPEELILDAGLDPLLRPERLSVEEFVRLSNCLAAAGGERGVPV
ncbi:MAG: 16S rRNA (adenine(1518)-N(6)/adenine(1519)-N(6))-dimethyltransferase RsmA [Gammaproteobacteria bacterium]|nr:MAG: 16S rRNA (adenine(1518)-N(6)/adenine(1519)-N(6))-dimethyltransferase RsmA [Gammaproteobacteria bacterium]